MQIIKKKYLTARDSHFYYFRYSSRHSAIIEFFLLEYSYWHFGMIRSILCDGRVHHLESFNRPSRMIKSTLWDGHIDPPGWSNRPFTMIKSIIFFWPSTDDQFDYLEGCPIVDHHIWSARPSRYSGWPSIFLRVGNYTKFQ